MSSDGTTTLIGAYNDDYGNVAETGSAYVFGSAGGAWSQQTKLTADDYDNGDKFGRSVALSSDGTTACIGAREDEDPNGANAGSAYVFNSAGGSWSPQAKLIAGDGKSGDYFGVPVTLSSDGDTALIGATGDSNPSATRAGSAYIFNL
jgi:hypothetical protein